MINEAITDVGARFRALFGEYGAGVRVAQATGLSPEFVSRVFRGHKDPPELLIAALEFLERTPPKDWPERWKKPSV